ncbi:MAG: sigma-70 family RNA polymerase sigma factor [Planctomycetota bacterium]|nr:sigma-70 family RNA polymerase sigma factor [Planctomycetota bacterium]
MLSNVDRELLQRCLARSSGGWEDFVERFASLVYCVANHTARARSVSIDAKLTEELVSDVFFEIVDNDFAVLRRFRLQSSLATYLTVVARRIITRRLAQTKKSRRRELLVVKESLEQFEGKPNGSGIAPGESAMESREEIEAALSSLSGDEAAAVRMYYLDGMNYRDISSKTGLAENSIGPYLSRAREKMRQSRIANS